MKHQLWWVLAAVCVGCAPRIELSISSLEEAPNPLVDLVFTIKAGEHVAALTIPNEPVPVLETITLPEGFELVPLAVEVGAFVEGREVGRGIVQLKAGQESAKVQLSLCSNGASEGIEACDDGNLTSGDGCDSTCKPTGCSSGVATPGELCFAENDDLRGPLGPSQVLAADLDGDAQPDLVAPYPLDGVVRIYPGDGRGVFGAFTEVPVPGVRRLALGDLDGDGAQDLVALSGQSATVLLADGAGGFFALPGPETLGADLVAAEFADFNQDGVLDLVTLDKAQGALSWRPGNRDGTFGGIDPAGQILPIPGSPVAFATGDLDADGDLDCIVVTSTGSGRVLLNNGRELEPDSLLSVEGTPSSVVVADFNNDDLPDIAVSKQDDSRGLLTVFNSSEVGKFRFLADFDAPDSPSSLVAVDLDLDGDIDLASTGETDSLVAVQFNNGAAQFDAPRDASGGLFETRRAPVSLAAQDLNGDGVPDLVAAGENLGLLLSNP